MISEKLYYISKIEVLLGSYSQGMLEAEVDALKKCKRYLEGGVCPENLFEYVKGIVFEIIGEDEKMKRLREMSEEEKVFINECCNHRYLDEGFAERIYGAISNSVNFQDINIFVSLKSQARVSSMQSFKISLKNIYKESKNLDLESRLNIFIKKFKEGMEKYDYPLEGEYYQVNSVNLLTDSIYKEKFSD